MLLVLPHLAQNGHADPVHAGDLLATELNLPASRDRVDDHVLEVEQALVLGEKRCERHCSASSSSRVPHLSKYSHRMPQPIVILLLNAPELQEVEEEVASLDDRCVGLELRLVTVLGDVVVIVRLKSCQARVHLNHNVELVSTKVLFLQFLQILLSELHYLSLEMLRVRSDKSSDF